MRAAERGMYFIGQLAAVERNGDCPLHQAVGHKNWGMAQARLVRWQEGFDNIGFTGLPVLPRVVLFLASSGFAMLARP